MHFHILFAVLVSLVAASLSDINLKPARIHDALSRRNNELFLSEKVELTYAENVGARVSERVFKSHFGLQADQPILVLEDFDHLLQDVRCSGSMMTITMLNIHVYEKARTACEPLKGGLLISSHFSCSEDSEHSFYRVLDLDFDDNTSSITLELESRTFEESFHSVTFHLSQSFERAIVHQHDRLFRRQAGNISVGGIATSTAPPDAQGTHESFDLKGFDLSIGLRAVPSAKFQQVIPIFTSPRFGINAGLVSAGINFGIGIDLQVETSGAVELGFGFDVTVPDSTLRMDIAELQNSFISGLNETKITPKLLEANASDVEVSLVAGLQPSITFGITLGIIQLDAGPYMDLPRLNMTVTQLATDDVGANCETDGDSDIKFKDAFQNLTHVEYLVGLAAGLKADVGPFFHPQIDLLSLAIPVATQCLAWQGEGTTTQLAPATAVLASITAPPSSTVASRKKSAAVALHNPVIDILGFVGISVQVFVAVVCAIGSVTAIV